MEAHAHYIEAQIHYKEAQIHYMKEYTHYKEAHIRYTAEDTHHKEAVTRQFLTLAGWSEGSFIRYAGLTLRQIASTILKTHINP